MSEKKIIDLARYRLEKTTPSGDKARSQAKNRTFEEKLLDFIHRPLGEPGSPKELIAIFEEEQLKKDKEAD
jgi:hypothetical protein